MVAPLDSGLFGRLQVHDLAPEAGALDPAAVHPHQHLRPVRGLGAAGTGVHDDDGVLGVVRVVEHVAQLQVVEPPRQDCGLLLELGQGLAVPFGRGQLVQLGEVAQLTVQLFPGLELILDVARLPGNGLGLLPVAPEVAAGHLRFDHGELLLLVVEVKDTPAAVPSVPCSPSGFPPAQAYRFSRVSEGKPGNRNTGPERVSPRWQLLMNCGGRGPVPESAAGSPIPGSGRTGASRRRVRPGSRTTAPLRTRRPCRGGTRRRAR